MNELLPIIGRILIIKFIIMIIPVLLWTILSIVYNLNKPPNTVPPDRVPLRSAPPLRGAGRDATRSARRCGGHLLEKAVFRVNCLAIIGGKPNR